MTTETTLDATSVTPTTPVFARCQHPRTPENVRLTPSCRTCGRAHEAKWRKSPHGKAVKKKLAKKAQIRVRELEARIKELEAENGPRT